MVARGSGDGTGREQKTARVAPLDARRAPHRTGPSRINSVESGQGRTSQERRGPKPQRLRQPASAAEAAAPGLYHVIRKSQGWGCLV